VVGAGAGRHAWWSTANGLEADAAGERLEEFLTVVRELWRGADQPFSGRHYRVPALTVTAAGIRSAGPPILLGATSPAGRRRAARLAQGIIHPGGGNEAVAAAFAGVRAALAVHGSAPGFELWRQVDAPSGREEWAATLATSGEAGATGVMVPHSSRLLDLLRNPDRDDDRVDLLLAQG
jgi:alkanesulfonate monooxygenase SsuD/methylene tetrahydromethanopterin reductase-like flavin-dependent oxidoreductase (luciferase family)